MTECNAILAGSVGSSPTPSGGSSPPMGGISRAGHAQGTPEVLRIRVTSRRWESLVCASC